MKSAVYFPRPGSQVLSDMLFSAVARLGPIINKTFDDASNVWVMTYGSCARKPREELESGP